MKLNFVFDKKSGDVLAPRIVPNHVSAIRDYSAMADNKEAIFNKFPEDFDLVTVDFEYSDRKLCVSEIAESVTPFVEIVGDKNGN